MKINLFFKLAFLSCFMACGQGEKTFSKPQAIYREKSRYFLGALPSTSDKGRWDILEYEYTKSLAGIRIISQTIKTSRAVSIEEISEILRTVSLGAAAKVNVFVILSNFAMNALIGPPHALFYQWDVTDLSKMLLGSLLPALFLYTEHKKNKQDYAPLLKDFHFLTLLVSSWTSPLLVEFCLRNDKVDALTHPDKRCQVSPEVYNLFLDRLSSF